MKKFLSLGAECVGFQETTRASHGMLVFVLADPFCSL
jgi:hypothetical protein